MKVYRPIKTNFKTQSFGENRACSKIGVRPFQVKIRSGDTCPPGYENFYQALGLKGHNGEDWGTWHGEPIYFPVDAKATWRAKSSADNDGGLGVDVISDEPILDESRVKFRFWHLKSVAVRDGDEVKFGQIIGYADSTGASSGDHLHWSMKKVDENGNTVGVYNGYYGAIDFSPYFENVFVLDVLQVKSNASKAIDLARKVIEQVRLFINNKKV